MAHGKKTGGRQMGTLNKSTVEIKAIAGQYSAEAIEVLIGIARNSDSDAARVSAVKELLDRAHGKAMQRQEIAGSLTGEPTDEHRAMLEGLASKILMMRPHEPIAMEQPSTAQQKD